MKIISLITSTLLLLIISNTAYSYYTDPSMYSSTCKDNGAIDLSSPTELPSYKSQSMKIIAKKLDDNSTFTVEGTWDNYKFTSEEAIFNESGDYNITLFLSSTENITKTVNCPGLIFSCRLVSISISRCYNQENSFYSTFNVENIGAFDPLTNLTYIVGDDKGLTTINPENRNIITHKSTLDLDVTMIEENSYKLRWFTDKNIKTFYIEEPTCNIKANKICTEPVECSKDSECLEFEYCDRYCKKLTCKDDEKMSNHKCLSCTSSEECDDSLACTEDKCINNKCSNEPIACIPQDKCTIGECKEPTGCIYTPDPECKKQKSINQEETEQQKSTIMPEEPEQKPAESISNTTIGIVTLVIILSLILYIIKIKKQLNTQKH